MSNERFKNVRPAYLPPSKPLIVPQDKRDNTPGVPLNKAPLPTLNLASNVGKITVQKEVKKDNTYRPEVSPAAVIKGPLIRYSAEHVCSDEEFIIKTRAHSIHDPGMKELFFANGGEEIVDDYSTLAGAFDVLRRNKMTKIAKAATGNVEYSQDNRIAAHDVKVFVPGSTPEKAYREREQARAEAKRRADNEAWLSQPIERKKSA